MHDIVKTVVLMFDRKKLLFHMVLFYQQYIKSILRNK